MPNNPVPRVKADLHLRALRSHFFEQSFHAIGQKKNEAIPLERSDVTVEKSWNAFDYFSKRALHFYDVIFSPSEYLTKKQSFSARERLE